MSSSSAGAAEAARQEVEDILERRVNRQETPPESDLAPVFTFLLPNALSGGASASLSSLGANTHWYCSKATSDLHRRAATYLIFLFAFQREGSSKLWIDTLAAVVGGCVDCARAFGIARREFGRLYLSQYPAATRATFFNAVDKWQSGVIISELGRVTQAGYGSLGAQHLLDLPPPFLQLMFNEPPLLDQSQLVGALDEVIKAGKNARLPLASLTPGIVHLLSKSEERRRWALLQMSLLERPLQFEEWRDGGVGAEVHALLTEHSAVGAEAQWDIFKALLRSGVLGLDAVQQGLLEGKYDHGSARDHKSLMALLARRIGHASGALLDCFTKLLEVSPTHHIWAFDPSPERPHTLFSEIKKNPSFHELLMVAEPAVADLKGKRKEGANDPANPLSWISDFLLSVHDAQLAQPNKGSGFSEALAKVVSFCFAEMQHDRLTQAARAVAAEEGFKTLSFLLKRIGNCEAGLLALNSTIDVHATFIASIAFQIDDDATWGCAKLAARKLVEQLFREDAREVKECVLGLAVIADAERRRLKVKRRAKPGQVVPAATRADRLHKATIRRELWSAAYNAFKPTDADGLALLMSVVAETSHIDLLNRHEAWNATDLKEAVKVDDWDESVRAINRSLQLFNLGLSQAIESVAAQPDPRTRQALFEIPMVAKSVVTLLLAPATSINEPILSLIQQSFDDVDDRGDCFCKLLEKFPSDAMDGLNGFLASFIQLARVAPEACALAKWLVRCFTDVLDDALCQSGGNTPPLLQSDAFLGAFSKGKWMSRRVSDLWQLMTDSLALIFKRTPYWAPFYDNEAMVDWMRDALIFGRSITEHIRVFESAVLSRIRSAQEDPGASPVKMSQIGKSLVQKLQVVLADLVGWLRLTDAETLHQAFELIKTILGRIGKTNPDLSTEPTLEKALVELDKFCRRVSSAYNCRLSDDLMSELSDLLTAFELPEDEDEVQFIKTVKGTSPDAVGSDGDSVSARLERVALEGKASASSKPSSSSSKPSTTPKAVPKASDSKNAFAMLMKNAGGTYTPSPGSSRPTKPAKPRQMTLKEFEDDSTLDNLSAADLDILERRAKADSEMRQRRANVHTVKPKEKLVINVVPSRPTPAPVTAGSFKSKFMRELSKEHKAQVAERRKGAPESAFPTRLPNPSNLGSGLGAYTGPPKPKAPRTPVESSGSSSSDDSDEENKGIAALLGKVKPKPAVVAVPKPVQRFTINRPTKILGGPSYADVYREREDKRARAHAMKQRLRPDLTPLFRYVLAWDADSRGRTPPYPEKVARELGPLRVVPTTFANPKEYEKVMLPLFLQELWAQFCRDDQSTRPVDVEVTTRAYEDDFLDIDVMVPGNLPPNFGLNETDVVTIKQPGHKPIFAKVQNFRRKFKESAIRLRILSKMDQLGMGAKSKLELQKHTTLSTALREFASLCGLPYYDRDILADVLNARSAAMPDLSISDVIAAMDAYNVNEPQARAILGAMRVKGFALIQGPPGTGKTKTISGLVGKFLSERKAYVPVYGQTASKRKILVCAPSNAAIDEVCKRLMDGVPSASGKIYPKIVRIGIESSVNVAVKDVSLDNIVEARVKTESQGNAGGATELAKIQGELEDVKRLIKEKQTELSRVQGNDQRKRELETDFHALNARRTKLGQASSKAKDAARDATRHLDGARRAARDQVLQEADIICATLSGSGQESLAPFTFETVIIDEAAQAIEMSCLIPLKYGCERCIMVGDPNQLPPTTFSPEAEANKFNRSLFVRIAEHAGSYMHLLSIQYRMHPEISELPSKVFYQGRLKDGPDMAKKTAAVWHQREIFGPYHFINVNGVEERNGTSTRNPDEARTAVDLYRNLDRQFGGQINLSQRIGVITMYKEQLFELKRQFINAFDRDILDTIDFNTVDGFQGQEKDIIILSCVRSGPNLMTIGFLRDFRRMNVALTRAKSSLFVIGNAATLERSDDKWNTIVKDARERGKLVNYSPTLFQSSEPVRPKKKPQPIQRSGDIVIPEVQPVNGVSNRKRRSSPSPSDQPQKRAKQAQAANGASSSGPPSRPPSRPHTPAAAHAATALPPPPITAPPPIPAPPTMAPPPVPPPPLSEPPAPKPVPSAAVRPPPPRPPARPTEDVLFMKKKKKPTRPAPPGPSSNVRAALNNHLSGGRRS